MILYLADIQLWLGKIATFPDPAERTKFVPASETKRVDLVLSVAGYHMHLDADRDGQVDDDYTTINQWEWGRGNKGAIILCNNDGDGTPSRSDNEDNVVNTGNDRNELAPLVFRRIGPMPTPAWRASLEVAPEMRNKIRIFESRTAGAQQILGKDRSRRYNFPDLNFAEKEFGMEAVEYAGTDFDGEITLTFTVTRGDGTRYRERGKVRVAPWIMPNHLDQAEKVYVVDSDNEYFRQELRRYVEAAGCELIEHRLPPNTPDDEKDIWVQDCMEWGYSSMPRNIGFRSVMRAPRVGILRTFPRSLRQADLGYHEQGRMARTSNLDSSGNLEVSPPVEGYPWGRIYYGGVSRPREHFDRNLRNFLRAQIVQDPISIDTSWLAVSHVDEIISFVPSNRGAKGFKLLIASPDLAYDILERTNRTNPQVRLLNGCTIPKYNRRGRIIDPWINIEVSVQDFLNRGLTVLGSRFDATHLRSYNRDTQDKLNIIKRQFETELGLTSNDIIDLAILFIDFHSTPLADALTAGSVNMLVINSHCIFPKPFGPVVNGRDLFQDDLERKLRAEGLVPHGINDWYDYHVWQGEVHCGTNTLRTRTFTKWWEFEP